MFLKLTELKDKPVYINMNDVKSFGECSQNHNITELILTYGTRLVKEKPDEIMEMMEAKNDVQHD